VTTVDVGDIRRSFRVLFSENIGQQARVIKLTEENLHGRNVEGVVVEPPQNLVPSPG